MEWYPTPSYLAKRKAILDFLNRLKDKDFLEVGCGAGDLLCCLEKKGYTGLGVDLSADAVDVSNKNLRGSTVRCEKKGIDEVHGVYGIVIASEVLEHHEDDIDFLHKLKDRLKNGGHLVISVPAHMSKWGPNDEFAGHVRRYERNELRQKLSDCGFEPLFIYSYGVPIYNIMKPFYDRAITKEIKKDTDSVERTKKSGGMQLFLGAKTIFHLLFNDITMLPFYFLQKLFYRTDLGNGYVALATKKVNSH